MQMNCVWLQRHVTYTAKYQTALYFLCNFILFQPLKCLISSPLNAIRCETSHSVRLQALWILTADRMPDVHYQPHTRCWLVYRLMDRAIAPPIDTHDWIKLFLYSQHFTTAYFKKNPSQKRQCKGMWEERLDRRTLLHLCLHNSLRCWSIYTSQRCL